MKKIYSKKNSDILLHIVYKLDVKSTGRTNIAPQDEFLQLAIIKGQPGLITEPHKHIWKDCPKKTITQESWVVIKGKAKFYMYDLDNTLISTEILEPGDVSLTFQGGHTYEILEEDTLVYEYKTGPYEGQQNDKEIING